MVEHDEEYQKAIELNPANANIYYDWGWALANRGCYKETIKKFRKAIELNSNYAEAYHSWGLALANQGQYDKAIEQYRKAIELKPDYVEVYNSLGLAFANQERYEEAIEQYRKAIELKPDYAEAYNNWGWTFANQRRYEEAIEQYRRAIELKPDYVYAHHNIANVIWAQGKYQQGWKEWQDTRRAYEQAKQKAISNNDSDFFYYYGSMLHDIFGDFIESEKAYKKGLELASGNARIWTGLAYLYLEEKDEVGREKGLLATSQKCLSTDLKADAYWHAWNAYRRAEDFFTAQSKEGTSIFLSLQMAELHLAMKEYEKAKQILTSMEDRALDQESATLYADLGVLYSREEDFKTAIRYFEAAKKRDPHNLTIRSNVAEAYLKANLLQKAEAEYERILSVASAHIESQIGLGEVYTAMGDAGDSELYDRAVRHFDEGIKIATNRTGKRLTKKKLAAAYYSSGYAKVKLYEVSGAIRDESLLHKALKDFKNCFSNDRDHHKAKRAQEKLQKRLSQFAPQQLWETVGPWAIFLLSVIVFGLSQYSFFSASFKKIISEGYYVLLTFGSLLFGVAGLYLPQILKLKVGVIELEKSSVEQITTPSSIGITKSA